MRGFLTEYVPSVIVAGIALQSAIELGAPGWAAYAAAFAACIASLAIIEKVKG